MLGEVLGRELRFEGQPDDEELADLTRPDARGVRARVLRLSVDGSLDEPAVLPTVQEVTGRPPRTFADWARAHACAFR